MISMQQTEQDSSVSKSFALSREFRSSAGFTLIELLIVLVVISILVAIGIPRMQGMKQEANQVKARAETRALGAALEVYYINQKPKAFPSSTTAICASVINNVTPLIIGDVLYDPFSPTEKEYNYIRSNNASYYVVYSVGLDLTADITGINDTGMLQGTNDDDIFWTNGKGF